MFPHFNFASTAQLYQQLVNLIHNGTINIPNSSKQKGSKRPASEAGEEPPKKKVKYANSANVEPVRRINGDPKVTKQMFYAKLREAKVQKPDRKLEKAQTSLEKYKQITELLGACFDPSNYADEPEDSNPLVEEGLLNDIKQLEADIAELNDDRTASEQKESKERFMKLFSSLSDHRREAIEYAKDTSLTWIRSVKKVPPSPQFLNYDNLVEIAK